MQTNTLEKINQNNQCKKLNQT